MQVQDLDWILVPLGVLVLGIYHVWLLYTLIHYPSRTVIGLNAQTRYQWALYLMNDPLKNGILAVQTIRNNMMASTLLATTAITLSSLIGVFASNDLETQLVYGNRTSITASIKRLSMSLCFLVAFLCNMQSIRYYAQASFLITTPALKGKKDFIEYVAKTLDRGSYAWSLGLRSFYLSIPLVLWIYGPIPMFVCSCLTSLTLYFLDTTTQITQDLHIKSFKRRESEDVEAA
ncbi:uncharacterized protein LOC130713490 [Lotus japonicus]|uniref:uncharacterized protein LOC130713490 n=1 Tax=Lotus japonicus TaxID=34305 RepID=UPI00258C25DE|nr:uncharacterized protein LOC130713490 [Lotus japonicus]